jgi:acyl carrier protein
VIRAARARARIKGYVVGELIPDAASRDPLADGLLDSLAISQLVAFLEDEFDVSFDDADLVAANFESLDAVAALVEAARSSPPRR